jgi:hypothetical protein
MLEIFLPYLNLFLEVAFGGIFIIALLAIVKKIYEAAISLFVK